MEKITLRQLALGLGFLVLLLSSEIRPQAQEATTPPAQPPSSPAEATTESAQAQRSGDESTTESARPNSKAETTTPQAQPANKSAKAKTKAVKAKGGKAETTTPPAQPENNLPELPTNPDELRFNFQGVPLDTVLDYLSRAGGFIIVRSADVSGRVDVVSHQALTRDEAVTLLNTVLFEKGYAAVRNGRTLTIVTREEAKKRNIPVRTGANPEAIPKNDEMVTQIIPVRHADASELINDIKGLLPEYATLTANKSSNAIVLTDTQTNVRRMAEIITALDQSISAISSVRVFRLRYADAKETADLITSLFQTQQTSRTGGNTRGGSPLQQIFSRIGGGGGPGGNTGNRGGGGNNSGSSGSDSSAALQAASRITAASDERTNSLVVAAPEEMMPTIEDLIAAIDKSTDVLTVVRVFALKNSNPQDMADVINNVFGQNAQTGMASMQRGSSRGPGSFGGRGGFSGRLGFAGRPGGGSNTQADMSERKMAENTVQAVADLRTNAVIVSAVSEVMDQVAQMIAELDQNPAKTKNVYVYPVKNADPAEVTAMLQQMFSTNAPAGTTSRTGTAAGLRGTSANQRNAQNNTQRNAGNTGFGSTSNFGRGGTGASGRSASR